MPEQEEEYNNTPDYIAGKPYILGSDKKFYRISEEEFGNLFIGKEKGEFFDGVNGTAVIFETPVNPRGKFLWSYGIELA